MEKWHYIVNGQQYGPITAEQLRQFEAEGRITTATLVWCEDLPAWTPLGFVPGSTLPGGSGPGGQAPLLEASDGVERTHPFEFRGRAGEFFRIWIVNVVLTVLTLGIYSAWAKVRTRRYFYGNTLLDGKPFDFTGNPISILKGNLIFGGLFVVYVVASTAFPPLALLVMIVIGVLMPWLIQKAFRFRAHNTVHRNVRFRFHGKTGDSYAVFLGYPMLIGFTLGILIPYVQFQQKRYFLGNLSWGTTASDMQGGVGYFYKTFFKLVAIVVLLIAVPIGLAVPALSSYANKAAEAKAAPGGTEQQPAAPDVAPGSGPDSTDDAKSAPDAGLPGLAEVGMVAGVFGIYALMFILFTYYQVRTQNYSINSTQWGRLGRIESKVRVRDLLWIYLTNGLIVLVTFGLMIPWVKIRMARYRASRTSFISTGSLDSVAAALSAEESAIGDAGADVFDFDIGF